jgi:pyruvate ferredoxin oxidoreductase gamma subunit
MYRVRFHGRGGQGIKTASRILGTAFFLEGFEVQDAPRYGAERRGAPIFAYVRADRQPIAERGPIPNPDLVIVADDTLVGIPAAGVLQGVGPETVLLINSAAATETWRARLNVGGQIIVLPRPASVDALPPQFLGAVSAGAAAALIPEIGRAALKEAIETECADFGAALVARNLEHGLNAYDHVAGQGSQVRPGQGAAAGAAAVDWITLPREPADISAPVIHAGGTSVEVRTGLWRTQRPVIDRDRCRHCWWVCSSLCPDSAIQVRDERDPVIDYDHCKGCMICVAVCPAHAIDSIPEIEAAAAPDAGGAGRTQ